MHLAIDDDDPVILILFVEFESFRKCTVAIDREKPIRRSPFSIRLFSLRPGGAPSVQPSTSVLGTGS
jgi:hypothetical protein